MHLMEYIIGHLDACYLNYIFENNIAANIMLKMVAWEITQRSSSNKTKFANYIIYLYMQLLDRYLCKDMALKSMINKIYPLEKINIRKVRSPKKTYEVSFWLEFEFKTDNEAIINEIEKLINSCLQDSKKEINSSPLVYSIIENGTD